MQDTTPALVLVINGREAQIMQDALTRHAIAVDREGDTLLESETADLLWQKIDGLKRMSAEHTQAVELVKAIGVGRYQHRPQG